ncbi:MAG: ATP phosphoribosyltransferase regulatory subunit [Clostridia bacterium]|nr:ATP phosphoribosyltransferase regulatory subunit [Clostridia bacterium]
MKRNRCSTPLGTKDLVLEESVTRRDMEAKLSGLFLRRGFSEVMTPGFEFLDVFMGENPAVPVESMYKMTDTKGRLMVMRPDSTLPIARLAATRFQNATRPLRLYYAQDVYHMNVGLTGRADQEFQAGVELIGAEGLRADLEIVRLAATALREVVGDGFRLEIGHVGFFEALMEELDADASVEEEIRDLIEGKNYAALSELLDSLTPCPAVAALRRLPHLFGDRRVLEKAKALCRSERGTQSLRYLDSVLSALAALGLEDRVLLDLGMLHSNEYYTGLIFRGYVEGSGEIALSGGRYDALLQQFGTAEAAVGFAISVDALMRVLKKRGAMTACAVRPHCLVHAEEGFEVKALNLVREYTEQETPCEFSVFATAEEARAYAREKAISVLYVVGETVQKYDVIEE